MTSPFILLRPPLPGTAIILVWGSDPDNVLRLDLKDMTVSAVRDGLGNRLSFSQDATGLNITINPAPSRNDVITETVDYGGTATLGPGHVEGLKRGGNVSEPALRSETSKWWLLGLMSQSPIIFDLAKLKATRGLWYVLRLRLAA